MKIKKPKSWINATIETAFYVAVAVTVLFFIELHQSPTKYQHYYGDVLANTEFTYPEKIEFYAFGKANHGTFDVEERRELYCSPMNSSLPRQLIDISDIRIDDFEFVNELPDVYLSAIGSPESTLSKIGKVSIQKIRDNPVNQTWKLDIIPLESSVCFMHTELTTWTRLFRIPKTTKFDSNEFNYIYESTGN